MRKDLQKASIVLLLLMIAGCNTISTDRKWPADLPKRSIFVDEYLGSRQLKTADARLIEMHLSWIVRFYQGTILYPNGWNRVSERFLASIERKKDRKKMAKRIRALGILIANEWAKDNNVRQINNSNVAVWGSALQTSASRNDQSAYIDQIERDVEAIIARRLKSSEIRYERYYPPEDYDNF